MKKKIENSYIYISFSMALVIKIKLKENFFINLIQDTWHIYVNSNK